MRPLACLVVTLVCLGNSLSAQERLPVTKLYRVAKQASVEILVAGHHQGSGWFAEEKGYIITTAHSLNPAQPVEILSQVYGRKKAKVVAVDLGHDLALLKVDAQEEPYAALPVAEQMPKVGSTVYLLGAPLYRHYVLQKGMIARDGNTFEYNQHFVESMHIAAMVQGGTSGGAWMNESGEVIGVQSSTLSVNSNPAGIAAVGPTQAIQRLIRTRKSANTPDLGMFIDELWIRQAETLQRFPQGTEGFIVQSLDTEGPAARAGIQSGDVITHLNGKPFRYRDDFLVAIRKYQPGDRIQLTILQPRGAGQKVVELQLGHLEVPWIEKEEPSKNPM